MPIPEERILPDTRKRILKFAVRPLLRRREHRLERTQLARALSLLDQRALGEGNLAALRDIIASLRRRSSSEKDPNRDNAFVALTRALYQARRISRAQYVFFAGSSVEMAHESRWGNNAYNSELEPIQQAIDRLRGEHGLGDDEEWAISEEPPEYRELNARYEAVLDDKLYETFKEFELSDLAELHKNNKGEYDRLRERGRRFVHHKDDDFDAALRDYIVRCEEEAAKAARGEAYFAAVAQLGAALEGLLLERCLRSRLKAVRTLQDLPRRLQRAGSDPTKWTFEVLIEVCAAAGWLPMIDSDFAVYIPRGLAHYLRSLRNLLHPARQVEEQPWQEFESDDYEHAHAVYSLVLSSLRQRKKNRTRSE